MIKQRFKKDDVVIASIGGSAIALVISDCMSFEGSFIYGFNYKEYQKALKKAIENGFRNNIPALLHNTKLYQEDIFGSLEELAIINLSMREAIAYVNTVIKE